MLTKRYKEFKKGKQLTALAMAGCLVLGSLAMTGCGSSSDSASGDSDSASVESGSASSNASASGDGVAYKSETVYVTTSLDGSVNTITVSDWLQNTENYETLTDKTTLSDVVNVSGTEDISQSGENLTIDANGSDIYYQGTSTDALPVDMTVTYTLDGKSISAEDLEGQSGEVTITISYDSNATVVVDGEKTTVPFVVLTGMMLSDDHFSNIEVTNGKVINNGNYQVVVGYSMPGLADSVDIDSDEVDVDVEDIFPTEISITADVEDYSVETFMSYYSSSMFSDLSLDDLTDVDDLTDALNELSEASTALVDGSSALADGAETEEEGMQELASSLASLSSIVFSLLLREKMVSQRSASA